MAQKVGKSAEISSFNRGAGQLDSLVSIFCIGLPMATKIVSGFYLELRIEFQIEP
jgi:hypothetical protein